ncbi:hypothetical protein [Polyangium jinanense]|uniref:Uncharacterized protein n=1 Tax=Polyangium jinanense TaxID=2829994 RepID=A0A9X4AWS8_9BACT|nr:hypothetical protein [Polyangium jinanense]MDC3959240.1 hypothetical protein [Polyangium jinanense]MDC3987668.1 hypothetical protein [Polyangium jinanense]
MARVVAKSAPAICAVVDMQSCRTELESVVQEYCPEQRNADPRFDEYVEHTCPLWQR